MKLIPEEIIKLKVKELRELAKDLPIEKVSLLNKEELCYKILVESALINGEIFGYGVLEILPDGYGFLRESSLEKDIYISASQVKKFLLRTGDVVLGEIRTPTPEEKNYALKRVILVNGKELDVVMNRVQFDDLVPYYPTKQVIQETTEKENIAGRIIDLMTPIGLGQRGLIIAPPKAGKTMLISQLANNIIANYRDEIEMWILLIDERPEEVTDIKESVHGATVFASTFDEDPRNHIKVTEEVIEKAKRLVEDGKDVFILMDSLTRLARAYNIVMPSSGKLISGGIDPVALYAPKRFFGSARNIRKGGSLTIIATALVDTGSRMDDVIYEEFKGTGNMEIHLDRSLAELRIFPAIDVLRSGTRKEDLLIESKRLDVIWEMRRYLAKLDKATAAKRLIDIIKGSKSNEELIDKHLQGGNNV
ncbi:MAG: transcription termination factor Rho [Fusobacteriaceae bacterium]|jgi:transcription termination factor Rho|nr:transcription termination factor Rho [Fusobacteriaceae bacterium]MBP6466857.1 transcription termination factor Rho [Fusobacteriaceae bacterium]